MKYRKPKGLADLKKAVKTYKNSVIVYDKWWEQITESMQERTGTGHT